MVAGQHESSSVCKRPWNLSLAAPSTLLSPTGFMLKLRWGPGFTLDAACCPTPTSV